MNSSIARERRFVCGWSAARRNREKSLQRRSVFTYTGKKR
jgi:hypothetical protein